MALVPTLPFGFIPRTLPPQMEEDINREYSKGKEEDDDGKLRAASPDSAAIVCAAYLPYA